MSISLLHPSRSRPEKALVAYQNWYAKAEGTKADIQHILSLDDSDPLADKYSPYFVSVKGPNTSVVEATNAIAKLASGDIMVYMSDDFDCPSGWDKLIENEFYGVDYPMLLKVDDCLQPFTTAVLTIPIMNRALYNLLKYFWNPEYKSMHVDEDLYWTVRKHAKIKMAQHLKFPHLHHSIGKADNDETYRRSEGNWNQGKTTLSRRRAQGFPI